MSKKLRKSKIKKPWFKFWPEGVPKFIDYPNVPLFKLLEDSAEKYPNQTAIIFYDRKISYRELNELSSRFANTLHGLGVKKGDVVALFLPNTPQYVIAYYGALKVGAIITAINPLYKERELQHQLEDSEAKALVILDVLYPVFAKIWDKTHVQHVIVTNIKEYMPSFKAFLGSLLKKIPAYKVERKPNVHFFQELLREHPPKPLEVEVKSKEDLAVLQYTGGTTGVPKGAMLTHFNLLSNAVMCNKWLRSEPTKDVHLTLLPLYHIYGMTTAMNAPISLAGTMVMLPKFDPVEVLSTIQKYRVTVFCGVPTIYAVLISHPDINKYDLSSINFCISGSAPLPPEVQKKFMELTGGVLVEGYGLSESSPVTHCNPFDRSMKTVKIGSIGLPWPDTDAKIVDLETGRKTLKPGEVGELAVKGPQVMKGYWKKPEDTKQVLRRGWLYTGDIGKMDEDGYFYITDRKKDIIKYKGYSVYPRELEDVLYEHPAVKLCGVIGKPDPDAGEIPKAFIVLKEGATATEEEIINFVKERVAPYKRIQEVEFRKELPMTAVGKVLRRILREEELKKMGKS